jgi:predicted nucleic acid-binding protein
MFIDTNIIIYYAAGDATIAAFLSEHKEDIFYLPSIVAAEFLSFPLIDEQSATLFRLFAQQTIIVNLDFPIAETAARLRKTYRIKLADAVIAAIALAVNSTLLTRNVRDFKRITELPLCGI